MTTFEMHRQGDFSGVSGLGKVLSGVIFNSGKVVVNWESLTGINSLGIYNNFYEFYCIHIRPHPENNTVSFFG